MKKLDKELLSEISAEKGLDKAFIEKDFYVVEVLRKLSSFSSNDIRIEFSGGTSLSKGFNLIKRFSEDIDFMIQVPESWTRSNLKSFRNKLIASIDTVEDLSVDKDNIKIADGGRFVSFYINYPQNYQKDALRPQVKVEISVKPTKLAPVTRNINSWIDEYLGEENYVSIDCIEPLETAANKFSALLWRIDCKDRKSDEFKKNDPTMIRHIYDLFMLKEIIDADTENFYTLVYKNYEDDKNRGGSEITLSLKDFAKSSLTKLIQDALYKEEYDKFVGDMIYNDSYIIDFDTTVQNFQSLIQNIP